MKKLIMIPLMAITAMTVISCGSSKAVVSAPVVNPVAQQPQLQRQASNSDPYGDEIQLTPCEEYAMAAPGKRAAGKGVSFNESVARQMAELDARAQFSNAITTAIRSASKMANFDITQYMGTDDKGATATDAGQRQNVQNSSFSANLIKNATIVKVNKYMAKNRQYTIFVCLEYNGSVAEMARQAASKVRQVVSDSDRAKIDQNLKAFEEEIENKLSQPIQQQGE